MRSLPSIFRIIGFALIGFLLLHFIGSTGETSIFIETPMLWAFLGILVLIYVAGEVSIAALQNVMYRSLSEEAKERYDLQLAAKKENQFVWLKRTYKNMLGSKEMEEEHEIILDHNYDGIKELDNKLPPWWVYGFYATIIFAGVYLARYHIFGAENQALEYDAAMAQAEIDIAEYKKTTKNLVDVNTVEVLTESSDLAAGKALFVGNCVACHKADGGGGIGPNLADEYWILGGGIKNVFNTISEGGRDGKGMVAWKQDFSPLEMAQVASYVLTFQGTVPAEPKEAEGEIWVEETTTEDAESTPTEENTEIETIERNAVSVTSGN